MREGREEEGGEDGVCPFPSPFSPSIFCRPSLSTRIKGRKRGREELKKRRQEIQIKAQREKRRKVKEKEKLPEAEKSKM